MSFERGEDEIVRYYEKIQPSDLLGIWGTELLLRVSFEKARRFMKKDSGWTEEAWTKAMLKKDRASILQEMEDMIQFAFEKSLLHQRNGSVAAIVHYMAWTWLINDMEMFAYFMDGRNFPNFGAPMFLAVAQKYDMIDLLPDKEIDKAQFMNMAIGRQCSDLCVSGCRRGTGPIFRPKVLMPDAAPVQPKELILPKTDPAI